MKPEVPKLFTVYLVYSRAHLASGLVVLDRLHRKLFGDLKRFDVVVDNQWVGDIEWGHEEGRVVVSGDNRVREFSGWDLGINKIAREMAPRDHDIVIIANDTFHRNYGDAYLKLFKRRSVRRELESGTLVGWVDGYPRAVNAMRMNFQNWIRSSVVMTTYGSLRRLLPLAPRLENYFSQSASAFFAADAPVDQTYRNYIEQWLFHDGATAEFRERWHSGGRLTPANAAEFRVKAQAIMCEHALSARAGRLGIPLFDVRRGHRVPLINGPVA